MSANHASQQGPNAAPCVRVATWCRRCFYLGKPLLINVLQRALHKQHTKHAHTDQVSSNSLRPYQGCTTNTSAKSGHNPLICRYISRACEISQVCFHSCEVFLHQNTVTRQLRLDVREIDDHRHTPVSRKRLLEGRPGGQWGPCGGCAAASSSATNRSSDGVPKGSHL